MKKVISALTAAAMCASMSASVMTAFAVYSANDVEFYLKVVDAGAGTVSADGTTVTFASAADAKNAKLTIQEFIKADTANPSVQQVGSTFAASAKGITLGVPDEKGAYAGVSYADPIGAAQEYDINGVTVSTDQFVSCFAYANKLKKFKSGAGQVSWGSSRGYSWEYDGPDQLSVIWASSFDDTSYDNYKETAHFAAAESDKYPFTQFDATIDDLADGTYTIDIIDSWEHAELGTQNGTFVNVDGKNKVLITNHPGITIVIGEGGDPDPTETDPIDTDPTETDPTDPSGTDPVDPNPGNDDKKNAKEFTWYIDDTYFDPETDEFAVLSVYVTKDIGISGFATEMLADGKLLTEAGFEILDITWPESGDKYPFGTFQPNMERGGIGAAMDKEGDDVTLPDGSIVVQYYVTPPADAAVGTVYKLSLSDLSVGNGNNEKFVPATIDGSLTIGKKGDVDPTDPTETDPTETDPTETDPTETDPTETGDPGEVDYLYGDVNVDGKVQLVDVVKLNRFLTGIDTQLSAVATVNANCYREAKESDADTTTANLSGKDSVEILRYLIGLVTTLPTQG